MRTQKNVIRDRLAKVSMETERTGEIRVVQGRCETMCPVAEMRLREREGLLHPFEIIASEDQTRRPKADPHKIVKSYSRPAAGRSGPSPADIRHPSVLLKTVKYLFKKIVPQTDVDWVQVYDFVFDRLRAVRQDAVIQGLDGTVAITLFEHIVCFHVYAGYRLCDAAPEVFDPIINHQHLLECLKRLLRLYSCTPGQHNNRHRFESLYLLHNLGSTESLHHGLNLPQSIKKTLTVSKALELNWAYLNGNYVRFFRIALGLQDVLCQCAIHRYFQQVRLHALQVMSVAYSSKNCCYPLHSLEHQLCAERAAIIKLAQLCGILDTSMHCVHNIQFQRDKFTLPTTSLQCMWATTCCFKRAQE
ncbi:SAC3 domain-containing protein 1-like isoform X2 [Pomacea canaliculata]|uniref:SAC3 domain-containing protein 1-like isoform X2 n=1 Tax=Pomacea canaliculata TaxID=400727 RepID=UPI000D725FA9|nr:SAC3 domain-containing protein 1-like isoform X2 [Pomacea canaliculata]XP_025081409.1 SAC3 domain-containing protein 1-like isoform X2 [Pomacea canaliculata]